MRKLLSAWNVDLKAVFEQKMPALQCALDCEKKKTPSGSPTAERALGTAEHGVNAANLDANSLVFLFVKRRSYVDLGKLKSLILRTPEEFMIKI